MVNGPVTPTMVGSSLPAPSFIARAASRMTLFLAIVLISSRLGSTRSSSMRDSSGLDLTMGVLFFFPRSTLQPSASASYERQYGIRHDSSPTKGYIESPSLVISLASVCTSGHAAPQ